MYMPGFTAEVTLRSNESQRPYSGSFAESRSGQFITPQEIKCSDDGRLCLDCRYDSNGRLLYCDVVFLPPVWGGAKMLANF